MIPDEEKRVVLLFIRYHPVIPSTLFCLLCTRVNEPRAASVRTPLVWHGA